MILHDIAIGADFVVGDELTVYEWCMIYTDRHPGVAAKHATAEAQRERLQYLGAIAPLVSGPIPVTVAGQDFEVDTREHYRITNAVYQQLATAIETGSEPKRRAYLEDRPGELDPTLGGPSQELSHPKNVRRTFYAAISRQAYRRAWILGGDHTGRTYAQFVAGFSGTQQDDVTAAVQLLREGGPTLRFPHSSGIAGSKHAHLRELRVLIGFMRSIFPLPIGSMTRIWQNADARG